MTERGPSVDTNALDVAEWGFQHVKGDTVFVTRVVLTWAVSKDKYETQQGGTSEHNPQR